MAVTQITGTTMEFASTILPGQGIVSLEGVTATSKMQPSKRGNSEPVELTVEIPDTSGLTVLLSLTAAETENLTTGAWDYDIQLVDQSGQVRNTTPDQIKFQASIT